MAVVNTPRNADFVPRIASLSDSATRDVVHNDDQQSSFGEQLMHGAASLRLSGKALSVQQFQRRIRHIRKETRLRKGSIEGLC